MDTLDYLKSIAHKIDGDVEAVASINNIAINTGLSFKQVRNQLQKLRMNNYIVEIAVSTYKITDKLRASEPEADLVRNFFCEQIAERINKPVNSKYRFVCYDKQFRDIATICRQEKLNIHTYIAACFDIFPANWCIKMFNRPYPPPTILLNRKRAHERYDIFMRSIMAYAPAEVQGELSLKQKLRNSLYVWKRLKLGKNADLIGQYVEIGLISELFFISLPFHDIAFISQNMNKYHIGVDTIKEARKILKELMQ